MARARNADVTAFKFTVSDPQAPPALARACADGDADGRTVQSLGKKDSIPQRDRIVSSRVEKVRRVTRERDWREWLGKDSAMKIRS